MSAATCRAPMVLPPGWTARNGIAWHDRPPLRISCSVEEYPEADGQAPMGLPGVYVRCVISRADRYPGWDEMRDFLRTLPWGDADRDWFMLLPPAAQYVNIAKTAFHWWQRCEGRVP